MMVPFGVATLICIYVPIASFAVGRQATARALFTTDVVIRGFELERQSFFVQPTDEKA